VARRSRLLAWLGAACTSCAPAVGVAPPGVERVVFVGDSLVSRSDRDHALLARVRRALGRSHPAVALDLVDAGVNGDCIADIRARLGADVLALRPAVVVLYWDSDAADVEDEKVSNARSAALRSAYARDLGAVLATLRDATRHVIVSGPTLLGERPHGRNPKDHVLDAYAEINHRLAREHDAAWVDTRRAAFRWLTGQSEAGNRARGRLTEDGEHLNDAGTELVAEEMAAAIGHWLSAREPPAVRLRDPAPPPRAP
jgi:lysophospholipase L1-like esterase